MSHGLRLCRRCLAALLLIIVAHATPLTASGATSHIRIIDGNLEALLRRGVAHSETLQALVARLDAEPILVFVRCEPRHAPGSSAAGLTFLTSTPTYRYVRVFIRCTLPPPLQLALLAHELQHALEVATCPDVVDAASLGAHYERIGFEVDEDHRSFETDAAIDVQRRVTSELARRSPQTSA